MIGRSCVARVRSACAPTSRPQGDQPQAIAGPGRGRARRARSIRCCSASPARGKTFTMAQRHRAAEPADARDRAQQDARGAALRRVPGRSSRRTPSATSSATTTTTSPRRTSRRPTRTSRRTRRSTTRSTRCATRRRRRCSSATTCIIVASVSCIYGLGSPGGVLRHAGVPRARRHASTATRCCASWSTSSTSATTTTSTAARSACAATSSRSSRPTRRRARIRIEFFGDTVEAIAEIDPLRGTVLRRARRRSRSIPASHYVTERADAQEGASTAIRDRADGAPRRAARRATSCSRRSGSSSARCYDLELLAEMGFCPGIENYSRHLDGRAPGRAAVRRCSTTSPTTSCSSSTRATSPCRRSAACTAATARARRRWSSSASACRRRSTTGRSTSTSSEPRAAGASTSRRRPGDCELRAGRRARRRAAHPPDRPHRPRDRSCARRAHQVDDLLEEIRERDRAPASACWSRRSRRRWPRT